MVGGRLERGGPALRRRGREWVVRRQCCRDSATKACGQSGEKDSCSPVIPPCADSCEIEGAESNVFISGLLPPSAP